MHFYNDDNWWVIRILQPNSRLPLTNEVAWEYQGDNIDTVTAEAGDSLAVFLVLELIDTYDKNGSDVAQLDEAARVLTRGMEDLEEVAGAFERASARASRLEEISDTLLQA